MLDSRSGILRGGTRRLVAASDDQLLLHRIVAALDASGLPKPVRAAGADEVAKAGTDTVVVLGCDLGEPARMATLRKLHKVARGSRIIVVSPRADATGVRRALDSGADGVVFDEEVEATLVASIVAVAAGQVAVPRRLRGGLGKPAFSHRERQVLAHVTAGLMNSEIADALFLSQSTVKSHLSSAFAKLGVSSRKEAAALVLDPEHGLGADLAAAGVRAP